MRIKELIKQSILLKIKSEILPTFFVEMNGDTCTLGNENIPTPHICSTIERDRVN